MSSCVGALIQGTIQYSESYPFLLKQGVYMEAFEGKFYLLIQAALADRELL